jgi:hypothetical protein
VPQVAVYKNGDLSRPNSDVGLAENVSNMYSVASALRVYGTTKHELRFGVL